MTNKLLSRKIEEMADTDQKTRKLWLKKTNNDFLQPLVYCVDVANNYLIKEIIKECGFPKKENIGAKTLKKFWLLVQHQDLDLKLQKECLENCDFDLKEKAYLTDRILLSEGKKQIYGTQFHKNKGKLVPRPIKNRKELENLRKSAGLEPFSEYKKKMSNLFPF
ncbi:MAG: hypothetical protein PHZ25_02635 [Candidatus Pacebacteria bacterium]|nr:hypothetical protein [Candidatus Paceibacterota bacterium]